MDPVAAIIGALEAEEAALDGIVAGLDDSDDGGWATPTPAAGWTVRDQIGHLALSEEWAASASGDPDGYNAWLEEMFADLVAFGAEAERRLRAHDGPETLAWWRRVRAETIDGVQALPEGTRIPWFGPPMGARAFLTARLMETWAHGQDIRDALGLAPSVSDRLRDIAHLGVVTRSFAYANRGETAPESDVSVALTGPNGDPWTWGSDPSTTPDRVSGSALDFCLVATQRRNVADTDLVVEGPVATDWLRVMQAFAGPATDPRPRA